MWTPVCYATPQQVTRLEEAPGQKALVGKKDSRKMTMDVVGEWGNVLGGGNRDAVIGARPALRYGTAGVLTVWAAMWHMVTTL